jgi:N4-gp56 family major capsid protein
MSVELKQFYDKLLLERALPNLVHLQFGVQRDIPARGGKSIEFRKMERITINTTALTEGTPPSETVATFTNVEATISQYGMFSYISDILNTQSFDPVVAEYTENYGEVMGDVLDRVVRDVITGGTTIQYASTAETLGAATGVGSGMFLDSAEIREAVNTLKRNDIKPLVDGKYVMIIHPDVTRDLFADPNIVDAFLHAAERGAGNPLFTGELGDYMGVRFVETTNAKIESSLGLSGADVYNCLLIGKQAYGVTRLTAQQARIITQPPGGITDPLEQASTIGWKAALAAVILDQNALVNVKVNTSRSLSA